MNKILYAKAIQNILPNVGFSIEGTDYSTFGFNTGETTSNGTAIYTWTKDEDYLGPTEEQILEEYNKLLLEYRTKEYQRLREPEYPDLKELADALYWNSKGDSTKLDEYYSKCEVVKDKYPKPE